MLPKSFHNSSINGSTSYLDLIQHHHLWNNHLKSVYKTPSASPSYGILENSVFFVFCLFSIFSASCLKFFNCDKSSVLKIDFHLVGEKEVEQGHVMWIWWMRNIWNLFKSQILVWWQHYVAMQDGGASYPCTTFMVFFAYILPQPPQVIMIEHCIIGLTRKSKLCGLSFHYLRNKSAWTWYCSSLVLWTRWRWLFHRDNCGLVLGSCA